MESYSNEMQNQSQNIQIRMRRILSIQKLIPVDLTDSSEFENTDSKDEGEDLSPMESTQGGVNNK